MAEVEALDKVWHPYPSRLKAAAMSAGGPFDLAMVLASGPSDHIRGDHDERGAA